MSSVIGSGDGIIGIGTSQPAPPPDSSFALRIEFEPGTANPQRIFQAATLMIQAFQALDRSLCQSIDSKIEPTMVLEDIEASSVKIWLKNILERVDDEALKKLDWKPLIGKYLVRAKYAYIAWSNKEHEGQGLLELAKELQAIGQEVDIKHIQDVSPPSINELAEVTKIVDEAKQLLLPTDRISYIPKDEPPIFFNLTARWTEEELSALSVKETTKSQNMPLTLIVKRPDYLGKSKWEFRFGKKPVSAKIEDELWLTEFQNRRVDIRPGDAIRCIVTIEYKYGYDNELIDEEYTITAVKGVVENQLKQLDLKFD